MIAERTVGGLVRPEKIEEMDRELAKVIEEFGHAVNVETLYLAKKIGKHSISQSNDNLYLWIYVDQRILLKQLKPVETGHEQERRCMEGTRATILKRIMEWIPSTQENLQGRNGMPQSDIYWVYGSPGIGKTSLAHSVCASLQGRKQLAGAFFCRRDDANLSDPRNILPTLIHKLAKIFPHFRTIVAEHLREDTSLTPQSMEATLFVNFIRSLRRPPRQHTLVFVIDALDECGDSQSRPSILNVLKSAAALAPWLKIIITSRPEVDIIQSFLDIPTKYDLGTDVEAKDDLRTFARSQFNFVASKWHLATPWPAEPLFNRVVSQANGLFIFIKTFILALRQCHDPEESLKETLRVLVGTGLDSLYGLYTSILNAQMVHGNIVEFWRMVTVIITAQHHPLAEEPIANLADVKLSLVGKWVDDLSSLLYRDERANGAIRVRHLSIIDYFVGDRCDYKANLRVAHAQLGITCLEMMVRQLRFNICGLEDSRLANADIKDLEWRIEQNISEPLQYSCRYWSNHLYLTPSNDNWPVLGLGSLKKFFEGLTPLFWIEVLSIMGMVPIGAPSLRRMISWVKVSTAPAHLCLHFRMILIWCRMPIRPFLREFGAFLISSSCSIPPSRSALHTPIFRRYPSYPHDHLYQPPSARDLLKPSG